MSASDADVYEGSLHRDAPRGAAIKTFSVPGGGPDEICVLPPHLPFINYRGKSGAKDTADEQQLAGYDFYRAGTAESGAVAISPKRVSTSAAVEVFALPAGTSRPEELTASYCATVEKTGKNVAKFKQTDNAFTTTSTASILGYYHVARALGDICEIRPAVLRTMDIGEHKKVVRLANEMGVHGTVAKSWGLFDRYYADPAHSVVAQTLFTSDFKQIYGALLAHTSGAENYAEWLSAGSSLSGLRAFQHMADGRPAATIIGSQAFTQANVQALVAMRDMSEMILLDYLFAQSDRLTGGNISDYPSIYYRDGDQVKSVKASKASDIPAGAAQVAVKKLTIKDTDAGLLNSNLFEQKGYLGEIHHLHPDTYVGLQKLAEQWQSDPAVKEFFHRECTFSNHQLAQFEKYLLNAANTLRGKKEGGTLRLDLDLDDYFQGVVAAPPTAPSPTAAPSIAGSVGRWESGAANATADIETVQQLLTAAANLAHAPALDPKGVDGKIAHPPGSSGTVNAIEAFESFASLPVDGLIDPAGAAWPALLKAAGASQGT